MKLFVANLQNPNQSKYISPKEIASFMLGRRLSNYVLMIVEPMTGFKTVVDISPAQGESGSRRSHKDTRNR